MSRSTSQLTVQVDSEDLAVVKKFFGTLTGAATLRTALKLAVVMTRTTKRGNKEKFVLVNDQNTGRCLKIMIT